MLENWSQKLHELYVWCGDSDSVYFSLVNMIVTEGDELCCVAKPLVLATVTEVQPDMH